VQGSGGAGGNKYEPMHNEASCDLLDALTGESGAVYETAGALRGGRETFVTMKLPEAMVFDGRDGSKDRTRSAGHNRRARKAKSWLSWGPGGGGPAPLCPSRW